MVDGGGYSTFARPPTGAFLRSGASDGPVTTTAQDRVSIRPAERADLLAVLGIERAAFPQPWPYQAFAGFLGEPGFLVAVDELDRRSGDGARTDLDAPGGDGVVCGYVVADVITEFGRPVGHVKDIAVHPDWRGRGIGSRLLSRGLAVISTGGARLAKLEVRASNQAAQELYRSFGFEANHVVSNYYDDGEDALLFVADLDGRDEDGR